MDGLEGTVTCQHATDVRKGSDILLCSVICGGLGGVTLEELKADRTKWIYQDEVSNRHEAH